MIIYKYALPLTQDYHEIAMPEGAIVLHVNKQQASIFEDVYLWAMVEPANKSTTRKFSLYGTGFQMRKNIVSQYVGTVHLQNGRLVLHVFEEFD